MIYVVIVGVALRRPPAVHEYRKTLVAAATPTEAKLIACQIAACTSVMPVTSRCVTTIEGEAMRPCFWPFRRHQWSQWNSPEEKTVTNWWNGRIVAYGTMDVQSKHCGRCGKVKTRTSARP